MAMSEFHRPDTHEYFIGIAMAVRKRANCLGNRVGAVIVKDRRIISTGYNGTPYGMPNCMDGGCHRCGNRGSHPSGSGYDLCICVHAEQNAILAAARFGIGLEGAELYTTMRPCFGCTKEMIQSKIVKVYYVHEWKHPDPTYQAEYERLQGYIGIERIAMEDPDADWAVTTRRAAAAPRADEHGHT